MSGFVLHEACDDSLPTHARGSYRLVSAGFLLASEEVMKEDKLRDRMCVLHIETPSEHVREQQSAKSIQTCKHQYVNMRQLTC